MAAPKGNKNAIGNSGGKSLNDRALAAEIRSLTLTKIKQILLGKESDYQRQILLRLTGNILPRLVDVKETNSTELVISEVDREMAMKALAQIDD